AFKTILDRLINDLPHKWIDFEDVYYGGKCIMDKETLKSSIIGAEVPLGIRLKQMEDFLLDLIQESKKERIRRAEKANLVNELQKFTELDVLELYRKLIADKEYFYALAQDIALCDNMEEIIDFTNENLLANFLSYDDAIVLT